jgi:hypothetical protein
MKHLLYVVPLIAAPLVFALTKQDKPAKSDKPKPQIDAKVPAKLETATFALG